MSKKFFQVMVMASNSNTSTYFTTKEEALDRAKQTAAGFVKSNPGEYDVYVLEAVAMAKVPVPDIVIIDLK